MSRWRQSTKFDSLWPLYNARRTVQITSRPHKTKWTSTRDYHTRRPSGINYGKLHLQSTVLRIRHISPLQQLSSSHTVVTLLYAWPQSQSSPGSTTLFPQRFPASTKQMVLLRSVRNWILKVTALSPLLKDTPEMRTPPESGHLTKS